MNKATHRWLAALALCLALLIGGGAPIAASLATLAAAEAAAAEIPDSPTAAAEADQPVPSHGVDPTAIMPQAQPAVDPQPEPTAVDPHAQPAPDPQPDPEPSTSEATEPGTAGADPDDPAPIPPIAPTAAETGEVKQFVITFRNWDQSLLREFVVDQGDEIAPLAAQVAPAREGYRFKHWYPSIEYAYAYQDATYCAVFDPTVYLVEIEYLFPGGITAAQPHIETLPYGMTYQVDSPAVLGFVPSQRTVSGTAQGAEEHIKITVNYYPDTGTPYVLRCYREALDGSYDPSPDITRYEYTGAMVTIDPPRYPGFTLVQPDTLTHRVAADGSTQIELYYRRNRVAIALDPAGGEYMEPRIGLFGAPVDPVPNPTRPGYTFAGWSGAVPQTFPENDMTFVANWRPEQANYQILHWKQNIAGTGYDMVLSEVAQAPTGTLLTADATKIKSGGAYTDLASFYYFAFDHADPDVRVQGDGSAVINYYYTRKTCTLNFYLYDAQSASWVRWRSSSGLFQSILGYWPDSAEVNADFTARGGNAAWRFQGWAYFPWTPPTDQYGGITIDFASPLDIYRFNWPSSVVPSDRCTLNLYAEYVGSGLNRRLEHYTQLKPGETSDIFVNGNYYAFRYALDTPLSWELKYYPGDKFAGFHYTYYQHTYQGGAFESEGPITWTQKNINGVMKVYHDRLSYTLSFYNSGTLDRTETVLYDLPIAPFEYVPTPPSSVHPDATFGGWYRTAECYPGSEVDWGDMMPAQHTAVFAKWIAPAYAVRFDTDMEDVPAPETQTVPLGQLAQRPPNPQNQGYLFVHWYRDAENIPFLFDTQRIQRDTLLTAKWQPRADIRYEVEYVDEQGNALRPTKTVSYCAMAATVTERAEPIHEWLPDSSSKSLVLRAEGNKIRFVYIPFVETEYTIRYRDVDDPGLPLLPDLTKRGMLAATVERSPLIPGYVAERGYDMLILSQNPDQNVLTFYYRRNQPAYYDVYHFLQAEDGSGYTVVDDLTAVKLGPVGKKILLDDEARNFEGYTLNRNLSTPYTFIMPNYNHWAIARLYIYYDLKPCEVVVHHYEYVPGEGPSTNPLLPDEFLTARAGARVTADYRYVEGHQPHSAVPESRQIVAQPYPAGEPNPNQIILYYEKGRAEAADYEVRHYRQAADGSYPDALMESETLTGYVGEQAVHAPHTQQDHGYANHTYAPGLTTSEPEGFIVNAQGTLVIKLYYKLDAALYLVRHHRQDTAGGYPDSLMEEDPFQSEPIGAEASFQWRDYPGYAPSHRTPEGTPLILADGSLVIDLYYDLLPPGPTPSPTPSPTLSPTPSVTPSVTPSPTSSVIPSRTPGPTASTTPASTPSTAPSVTPSPTPKSSPTPTATPDPIVDPINPRPPMPPMQVGSQVLEIRDSDVPLSGIGSRNLGDCPR